MCLWKDFSVNFRITDINATWKETHHVGRISGCQLWALQTAHFAQHEVHRRRQLLWTYTSIDGESTLIGLPEYRGIMHDEDIRTSYLEGRFGGTPQLDSFTLEK